MAATGERLSSEPRFRQVAAAIASAIADGEMDGRLPTEHALGERFGVSRVTMRRALSTLEKNGLVTPSWGRGWFVIDEPLSESPNELLSFTELARRRGLTPSARVLGLDTRPANLDEAGVLRVAPGSLLWQLDRLRLLDGVPAVLQRSLFALVRLGGLPLDPDTLDLEHSSVYAAIEDHCGVVASRADYVVEARPAESAEADLLGIAVASPVLATAQITFDQHDEPFEQHWSAYPHDRYRFQATLLRPSGRITSAGAGRRHSSAPHEGAVRQTARRN